MELGPNPFEQERAIHEDKFSNQVLAMNARYSKSEMSTDSLLNEILRDKLLDPATIGGINDKVITILSEEFQQSHSFCLNFVRMTHPATEERNVGCYVYNMLKETVRLLLTMSPSVMFLTTLTT